MYSIRKMLNVAIDFGRVSGVLVLLCVSFAAAAGESKQLDMVYSKLVSVLPNEVMLMASPYADALSAYGDDAVVTYNTDSDAIGGKAIEIKVTKAKNPWDVGLFNPIGANIKKGDVIYITFFAKALVLPEGKSTTVLKNVGIQEASQPYLPVMIKDITLTENWQSFALAKRISKSFKEQDTQVTMQLANAEHTIAVGPVFVFNVGPDIDVDTLPFLTE